VYHQHTDRTKANMRRRCQWCLRCK